MKPKLLAHLLKWNIFESISCKISPFTHHRMNDLQFAYMIFIAISYQFDGIKENPLKLQFKKVSRKICIQILEILIGMIEFCMIGWKLFL